MTNESRERLLNDRYYQETQTVAQTAWHLSRDNPDLTWGECIRIAEKWAAEKRT